MGRIRRQFDAEFKRKVVSEIQSGARTLSSASRDYSIAIPVIKYWMDKVSQGVSLQNAPTAKEKALEKENNALKAKIGDLVMQVEVLKKMDNYLRQHKRLNTSIVTEANLNLLKELVK